MADQSNKTAPIRTALVLGATGGVGGAVTEALLARGWTLKALTRDPARSAARFPQESAIQWIEGDATDRQAVVAAAEGCGLIVHAVNPPGYRDWDKLIGPWMDNTIAAARASGARVLLPGNVYNYGPDAFPVLAEDSPQHPLTRKGKLRVAMEERLRASGVPAIVVRAGDFFGGRGGGSGGSWFSRGLVKPGSLLKAVARPGRPGVGHAWAYLPDLAETMVLLAENAPARGFQSYHFAGHYDADGEAMIGAVQRAAGRPLKVSAFPWPAVTLLSPFVRVFREVLEMRYLWQAPLRLDNAKLVGVLGHEPHTPLDEAVGATLRQLKCL
jgi:nucleoside-diphosphate-sugar epimerase